MVKHTWKIIKINFLGNEVPKENMHYTCIVCITFDSVMRMDQKSSPQIYLEEWKYRIEKILVSRFVNAELKPDLYSESDSEAESKSDAELKAKLKLIHILILNESFYFQSSRFNI